MKKSQLRNIIKESINKLVEQSAPPEQPMIACSQAGGPGWGSSYPSQPNGITPVGQFGCHGYKNCTGNQSVWAPFVSNVHPTSPTGNMNNEDFHQWLGSPSVGEVVTYELTWPTQGVTHTVELEYVGNDPSHTIGTHGHLAYDNPQGPFANCSSINTGTQGVFHEWQGCSLNTNWSGILYAQSLGGWSGGTGTGGSATQPWATHQNSNAFWQGLGSPSPGQVIGYDVTSGQTQFHHCIEYVGTVTSGTHGSYGGGNSLINITQHPDCNDCENTSNQPSGSSVQACDCNYYNQNQTCVGSGAVYSPSYPITIGGNPPAVGDTFTKPNDPTVWAVDVLQNPVSTCAASVFASINCDLTLASCTATIDPCADRAQWAAQVAAQYNNIGIKDFCKECESGGSYVGDPLCDCCECKKCCCEISPITNNCISGTEVWTASHVSPCDCSTIGLQDCGQLSTHPKFGSPDDDTSLAKKPFEPVNPIDIEHPFDMPPIDKALTERMQKLANIIK